MNFLQSAISPLLVHLSAKLFQILTRLSVGTLAKWPSLNFTKVRPEADPWFGVIELTAIIVISVSLTLIRPVSF